MEPRCLGVCFLFCVCFIEIKGSSSQPRFIQTNRNLLMTVTEEVQIGEDIFLWKFNNSKTIIRLIGKGFTTANDYKGRVDFFPQNLTLILKNVQLRDSGIYTAVVSQTSEDKTHATYDVTVQAPVSAVLLRVDSVFNSSNLESCNFTVNCTTESSSISRSFTCDRFTCEEANPVHSDPAPSLHLYLSDKSIICNHSNHISWTNDTKDIQQVCPLFGTKEPVVGESTAVIGGVTAAVIIGVLCVLSVAVAVVLRKRRKSQRISMENTVYEIPQVASSRPAPGPDPAETENPTSIYSLAGSHSGYTPAPVQNTESLYATVNKPQAPDLLQSTT